MIVEFRMKDGVRQPVCICQKNLQKYKDLHPDLKIIREGSWHKEQKTDCNHHSDANYVVKYELTQRMVFVHLAKKGNAVKTRKQNKSRLPKPKTSLASDGKFTHLNSRCKGLFSLLVDCKKSESRSRVLHDGDIWHFDSN